MVVINIEKKHLFFITFIFIALAGLVVVMAQTSTLNPGHTASEISGVCKSSGVDCPSCLSTNDVVYKVSASTQCTNPILCYPDPNTLGGTPPLTTSGFSYISTQGGYGYTIYSTWYNCVFVLCKA